MIKNCKRGIFLIGVYKVGFPLVSYGYQNFLYYFNPATSGESNYSRLMKLYGSDSDKKSKKFFLMFQPYVLVTGGSDGIGKQLALEFAKSGFNLLLVSRSQDKLNQAKSEIQLQNPNIEVETVTHDFSRVSDIPKIRELFDKIHAQDINLKILINNFKADPQKLQDELVINVHSQVFMTKYFHSYIKQLKLKEPYTSQSWFSSRNYGEVHFSSFLTEDFGAYRLLYTASKQMINFGNRRSNTFQNLDYLVVKPSLVKTAMTGYKEHWRSEQPWNVSYAVARSLGIRNEIYGAWRHESWAHLRQWLPYPLKEKYFCDPVYQYLSQYWAAQATQKKQ